MDMTHNSYVSLAGQIDPNREIRKEQLNIAKCFVKASLVPLLSISFVAVASALAVLFHLHAALLLLASGLFILSVMMSVFWVPRFVAPIKLYYAKILELQNQEKLALKKFVLR